MMADLGYNMNQVMDPKYGLSFSLDCELDMRYDNSNEINCYQILNKFGQYEIDQILKSKFNI